jgi:hypothetical protein
MKNILKFALVAGTIAAGTLSAAVAEAASFGYSYDFGDGNVLTGELEGEVQDDGDTIVVSDIISALFNGSAVSVSYSESVSAQYGDKK